MSAEYSPLLSLVTAFRDRYEIVRETGRGGSATVYLARDLKHDRFVAIKVLNPDLGATSGDRFLREIQVSAGMQHPHILPTYDSGVADGRLYFVMPFVDGGSLRQRLKTASALPIDEALKIARDIGIALQHAHNLGVIHRDVKPENIMFYHGTACLADFGVARAIEEMDPGLTAHGAVVGTPAYMSPEQYLAGGFDGRSDVYSLACVLYEMIAGARLYAGSSVAEVLAERNKPPSIRQLRPKIPESVDELLTRGLAHNPDERYRDAQSFVSAIDYVLHGVKTPPERISAPRRALATVRQHKLAYTMAAAVLVASAGFAWPPLRNDLLSLPSRLRSDLAPGARRAFFDGKRALDAWDIPGAQKAFALAVSADPNAPIARLWHAESFALARQMNREDSRIAALRLANLRTQLHGRDSLLAAGLSHIATGKPAAACEAYAEAIARDSLDVLAWYGMGDCQQYDSTVVRDPKSASGWSFNSSFHSSARAYMRAVAIEPQAHSAFPYDAMTRLLPSDVAYVRFGFTASTPRQTFAAYPSLVGDTVAFVPYPMAQFTAGAPRSMSSTQPDALRRNREVLMTFAKQWATSSPNSADAWEGLALAREGRGELTDDDEGVGGAIRHARELSVAPIQQARLATFAVRIHLKHGDFAKARALADSMLGSWQGRAPPPGIALHLNGLAELTGHVSQGAAYRTLAISERMANAGIQPPLTAAADKYFMRSAAGLCDDSLGLARAAFERALNSYAPVNRHAQLRQIAIGRTGALAYPCLRSAAHVGIPAVSALDRAQRAFEARDRRRARSTLDSLTLSRSAYRPGDIAFDHTVQEAWLKAAAGDSVGASAQLDLVLDALPTLSALVLYDPAQAAAFGRAMVLRADLAAGRRNTTDARRWASAALDLLSGADAAFKPTLDRMRLLANR